MGEVVVVGLGPGADRWTTPEVHGELAEGHRHRRLQDLPGADLDHGRGSGCTPATTASNPNAPAWHWTWPRTAPGSSSSAPVIPASSPWPPPSSRSRPNRRGATCRCAWCRGMTAANAVAAAVGAPLGHDYAVISLSDRLKSWDVIERRLHSADRRGHGDRDLQPRLRESDGR